VYARGDAANQKSAENCDQYLAPVCAVLHGHSFSLAHDKQCGMNSLQGKVSLHCGGAMTLFAATV
jgi:hypothetical protein